MLMAALHCLETSVALGKSTVKGPNKGNDEGREWKTKEDVKQRWEMGIIHMSCLAPFS